MDSQSTSIRSERCMRVDEKMLKDARKLLKFGVKYDFKLFEYKLNTPDSAMCQNLLS